MDNIALHRVIPYSAKMGQANLLVKRGSGELEVQNRSLQKGTELYMKSFDAGKNTKSPGVWAHVEYMLYRKAQDRLDIVRRKKRPSRISA